MSPPGVVGGLSVRGSSHVRASLPNQDAIGHCQDGDWTFMAVSDGHGSSRHYRSDRGAAFAVRSALELLRAATGEGSREALGRFVPRLAQDLVATWLGRVDADLRSDPVREPPGFESYAAYGATCVAAAIGPGLALFVQIGDGDAFAAGPGGEVARAVPQDPHLVGPATYSLCQPDAVARVHVRMFETPHAFCAPDFVLLATDGLSKSYPRDDLLLDAVRHLRDSLRVTDLPKLIEDLRPWLSRCSELGSRDDATLALFSAIRVPVAAE